MIKTKFSRGQRFICDNTEYILARGKNGREMVMVNLVDGNIWRDPFMVKDPSEITLEEMNIITKDGDFELKE
jgi:hypothetical protein